MTSFNENKYSYSFIELLYLSGKKEIVSQSSRPEGLSLNYREANINF